MVEHTAQRRAAAAQAVGRPWWRRMTAPALHQGPLPQGAVQMLWANMALHMSPQPQVLIGQWHRALAPEGFLMFSCLGPDTLRELRTLYRALGWPPSGHDFTDMHDWGDMLVHAGFAEPVMDMERITLTWETPARLLDELRELGANLHPARFAALRGRRWRERLDAELAGGPAPARRPTGADFRDHLRPCAQARAPGEGRRAKRGVSAGHAADAEAGQAFAGLTNPSFVEHQGRASPAVAGTSRATIPG